MKIPSIGFAAATTAVFLVFGTAGVAAAVTEDDQWAQVPPVEVVLEEGEISAPMPLIDDPAESDLDEADSIGQPSSPPQEADAPVREAGAPVKEQPAPSRNAGTSAASKGSAPSRTSGGSVESGTPVTGMPSQATGSVEASANAAQLPSASAPENTDANTVVDEVNEAAKTSEADSAEDSANFTNLAADDAAFASAGRVDQAGQAKQAGQQGLCAGTSPIVTMLGAGGGSLALGAALFFAVRRFR